MIECTRYKSVLKGSLQGFATLMIPKWGISINSVSLFMKNGRRWINLPSKKYEDQDGATKYASYIFFDNKAHMEVFNEEALKAIDKFCASNQEEPLPHEEEGDFPF